MKQSEILEIVQEGYNASETEKQCNTFLLCPYSDHRINFWFAGYFLSQHNITLTKE